MYMKINSFHLIFVVLFMYFVTLLSPHGVLSKEEKPQLSQTCPSEEEILAEVAVITENLQKIRLQLKDFLSGDRIVDARPEALLIVDLDDKESVERRREELRRALTASLFQKKQDINTVLQCAFDNEQLRAQVENIFALNEEVDRLRLKFLDLPKNQRDKLLKKQGLKLKGTVIKKVLKERSQGIEAKSKAKAQIEIAEHMALTEESEELKELAAERVVLEKTKLDIITIKLQWLSQVEERVEFYTDAADNLLEIRGISIRNLDAEEIMEALHLIKSKPTKATELTDLRSDYVEAVTIWRTMIDKAYGETFKSLYTIVTLNLPRFPHAIINEIGDTPAVQQYRDSYREAQEIKDSLYTLSADVSDKESRAVYQFILAAGHVRSDLLHEILRQGDRSPLDVTNEYVEDIKRELTIIPYRWLALLNVKMLDIRTELRMGLRGIIQLVTELFQFLVFLSFFVLFWLGLKRLTEALNWLRLSLIKRGVRDSLTRRLVFFIKKLIPYAPWLVILPATKIGEYLIAKTVFSEFTIILPYISIYSVYRILRLLIKDILTVFAVQFKMAVNEKIQVRINKHAKVLSLLIFFSWMFSHALESIVSEGLVYHLVLRFVIYSGIVISVLMANQWKNELAAFVDTYAHYSVNRWIAQACRGKLSFIICLPVMLVMIVILLFSQIVKLFKEYDIYKEISATLLRRKLEITSSQETDDQKKPLPDEYTKWFTPDTSIDKSLLVILQNDLLDKMMNTIDQWQKESSEIESIAIYGDRGTGKSWILSYLESEFQNIRVLKAAIPSKVLTRNDMLSIIENLLEVSLVGGVGSLTHADKKMPKTLILFDNAQNLFLSKLGGFEGFKTLLELVGVSTKNLFLCAAFTTFSWTFLDSIFSRKRSFDMVEKIPPWSDRDIKDLILTRQNKTNFRLSYDGIINAAGSERAGESTAQVESNFFTILRQHSGGNPKAALYFWLSSLRVAGPSLLRVGLPEEVKKGDSLNLLEDELFVYAQIIRHGSLSVDEVIAATDLPEALVKQTIRDAVKRRSLICSDSGQCEVTTPYQDALINNLRLKNFIYGK